jgi:hypothetical protein
MGAILSACGASPSTRSSRARWGYEAGSSALQGGVAHRLMSVIRNDRYKVDEERQEIHLKDFKLTLKFEGKLKWHGKQARLEMIKQTTSLAL